MMKCNIKVESTSKSHSSVTQLNTENTEGGLKRHSMYGIPVSLADDPFFPDLDTQSHSPPGSPTQDKDVRNQFGLFWHGAGHWLDAFQRIDSYPLNNGDIIELQNIDHFVYLPKELYHYHYAEGELNKLSGGLHPVWKKRWFVLQGRILWYSAKQSDPSPTASADLSKPFVVQETSAGFSGNPNNETCLVLKFGTSTKCWWLKADDAVEIDHWRRILITLHKELSDHCNVAHAAHPKIVPTASNITEEEEEIETDTDSGRPSSLMEVSTQGDDMGMPKPSLQRPNHRIKAGFMFRKMMVTNNYKPRYFVLRGKGLTCYRSDRFDKPNNQGHQLISLIAARVTYYHRNDRYYFIIVDEQDSNNMDHDDLFGPPRTSQVFKGKKSKGGNGDGKSAKKAASADFKSFVSSAKSLPMRLGGLIQQAKGGQRAIEKIFVETESEFLDWKYAIENIAGCEVTKHEEYLESQANDDGRNRDTKSMLSRVTASSIWTKIGKQSWLKGRKPKKSSNQDDSIAFSDSEAKTSYNRANNNSNNSSSYGVESNQVPTESSNGYSNSNYRFSKFLRSRNNKEVSSPAMSTASPSSSRVGIHEGHARSNTYDDVDNDISINDEESVNNKHLPEIEDFQEIKLTISNSPLSPPHLSKSSISIGYPEMGDNLGIIGDERERDAHFDPTNTQRMQNHKMTAIPNGNNRTIPSGMGIGGYGMPNHLSDKSNEVKIKVSKMNISHKFTWMKRSTTTKD
jgi:hypothetical protein